MNPRGTNAAFGAGKVELGDRRWTLATQTEGEDFPRGTKGLIPVVTLRKDGTEKTSYAFPVGEGCEPDGAAQALDEAVALLNRLLDQACELARHGFGYVDGIAVQVPERGWAFTRVEMVPRDAHGQESATPLHLIVETGEPGSPDSLEATLEYDRRGEVRRVAMTEHGESGYTCRVVCTVNSHTGRLSVHKVEESDDRGARGHLLYKRGWEPKGGFR